MCKLLKNGSVRSRKKDAGVPDLLPQECALFDHICVVIGAEPGTLGLVPAVNRVTGEVRAVIILLNGRQTGTRNTPGALVEGIAFAELSLPDEQDAVWSFHSSVRQQQEPTTSAVPVREH